MSGSKSGVVARLCSEEKRACIQDRFSQLGYKLNHTLEELLVHASNEDHSEQLCEVLWE